LPFFFEITHRGARPVDTLWP